LGWIANTSRSRRSTAYAPGGGMEGIVLFGGSASGALTAAVADELGIRAGERRFERFPDGETSVVLGQPVRGLDVFVLLSTSPPVNDHLMELLIFADACRRASAERITAVVPYFGYARSDRRDSQLAPIAASLVAELMQSAGIGHVTMVDVHAPQIEGFFRVPVDHLTAVPALCDALHNAIEPETVVVSPDSGRVQTATQYARRLGLPLVVLHKRRGSAHETTVTHVVGDVRDRRCLIIDDMISTGGTIAESAAALRDAGSRGEFIVAATHGLFVEDASERMAAAGVERVYVTDSIAESNRRCPFAEIVSIAPLLARSIRARFSSSPVA
jgi:ribose-phosphate pyrophosphokinase